MESDDNDSSTSDEEYVPPIKISKTVETDESSDDESDDGEELSDNDVKNYSSKKDSVTSKSENLVDEKIHSCETVDQLKAREDAIWNDFIASVEHSAPKNVAKDYAEVSRTYQFAGEEIQVTERVPVDYKDDPSEQVKVNESSQKLLNSGGASSCSTGTTGVNVSKPPIITKSGGLGGALNKLKSITGNKTPKLSTLEKSRLDWQTFVRTENIEDDLKAHNKGKQGYLERCAFMDRAAEREYAYQKSQTKRKT